VPAALVRIATDRFALRHTPGACFAKLLGTGGARTFSLRDARPDRWALLVAWSRAEDAAAFEHSAVARRWTRLATEHWRLAMTPLGAHGHWSHATPFGAPRPAAHTFAAPTPGAPSGAVTAPDTRTGVASPRDEVVAVLTRARLRWRVARSFWRAVPPVAAELAGQDGLLIAFGIGERPVGVQGTFSLWRSAATVERFAYRGNAHAAAIRQAGEQRWYAEELFARFAVVDAAGSVDGRDPLEDTGWGERAATTR
jgi:hypothetical protein